MAGRANLGSKDVASILDDIGDMLEIQGEIPFKTLAYHRAANAIRGLTEDISKIKAEGRLTEIHGVGKGIAEKIDELLETGSLVYYEELKENVPPSLLELMQIPSVGPKKAKLVYDKLCISSIDELQEAARKGKLRDLPGMGAVSEENILKGIEQFQRQRERILLFEALPLAQEIVGQLKAQPFVEQAEMAGSLRRRKETIGDIDLLASSNEPGKVADFFTSLPEVERVLGKGETKSSVVMESGLQVDLRVVSLQEYGSALQYFTGSKEHSVHLRGIAKDRGMKISEYGIFRVKSGKRLGGKTEEEIYKRLGMETPPPVLREDRGEIEAAMASQLPELIGQSDLKGDLHVHSVYSDGYNTLGQLIETARQMGYKYLGIADHAEKLKVAGGLTLEQLEQRLAEIEKLNSSMKNFCLLSGIELNIDNEGKVDYSDDILAQFDIVIASVHTGFGQPKEKLTYRTVAAMNSPHIDMIAHPTGRILGKREPYELDLEEVFRVAAQTGTVLELNSYPDRLDLRDDYLIAAKRLGCKFAINTDAHAASHMRFIEYGIYTAQRGWLAKEDVINTYPVEKLRKLLGR